MRLAENGPIKDKAWEDFSQGGTSFPSDHSAVAWSIASVIAHEYPGPLTQIAAYGLATAVSATRVLGEQHFPSDVVVGGAHRMADRQTGLSRAPRSGIGRGGLGQPFRQ